MIQHLTKKHKGFTLIELLVVIAIIGVLASIVLVSLGGARVKARNARRQSDIRQISLAQEMCMDDSSAACGGAVGNYATSTPMPTAIGTYLNPVPFDPQGAAYGWASNAAAPTQFCAYATLEPTGAGYFAASEKGVRATSGLPALGNCW